MFKKINCDKSVISDMLGGVAGATEGNMMQVNNNDQNKPVEVGRRTKLLKSCLIGLTPIFRPDRTILPLLCHKLSVIASNFDSVFCGGCLDQLVLLHKSSHVAVSLRRSSR